MSIFVSALAGIKTLTELITSIKIGVKIMTVNQLIEKLKEFDPETLVVTRGFDETGYSDLETVEWVQVAVRKSESARDTLGEYEDANGASGIKAILIDHT